VSLFRLNSVSLEFGDVPLLKDVEFSCEPGERVCVIGRNGAGKSTLLKVISGEQQPDSGEVQTSSELVISTLAQTLPEEMDATVFDHVKDGMASVAVLVEEYRSRSERDLDSAGLRELEQLQSRIEAQGGWEIDQKVDFIIEELSLPRDLRLSQLSGGWRLTSLRTISISKQWSGLRTRFFRFRAALFSSRTIACFCKTSQRALSNWIEARSQVGTATTKLFLFGKKNFLKTKIERIRNSTKSLRKKRPGSGKGSRPVEHVTRAGQDR